MMPLEIVETTSLPAIQRARSFEYRRDEEQQPETDIHRILADLARSHFELIEPLEILVDRPCASAAPCWPRSCSRRT